METNDRAQEAAEDRAAHEDLLRAGDHMARLDEKALRVRAHRLVGRHRYLELRRTSDVAAFADERPVAVGLVYLTEDRLIPRDSLFAQLVHSNPSCGTRGGTRKTQLHDASPRRARFIRQASSRR